MGETVEGDSTVRVVVVVPSFAGVTGMYLSLDGCCR